MRRWFRRSGSVSPIYYVDQRSNAKLLALVNDQPRAATVTTTQQSFLTRCEKAEYNRVLKFIHESAVKDGLMYFSRIPAFASWSEPSLRPFVAVTTLRVFEAGTNIMVQGEPLTEMYFIKEGRCACYKVLQIQNSEFSEPVEILLGHINAGGYIGETCIFINESNEKAYLTIKADTRCVLYAVPIHDARTKLSKAISLHEWYRWDKDDFLGHWRALQQQKQWAIYRRETMTELAKERTGNPNENYRYYDKTKDKSRWN